MNYDFKQLTLSDVGLLKDLLRVFGDAFEDVKTYQGAVPGDHYLQSLLAKPHFIAVIARLSNDVIGGLAAYELDKFEQDRREIYIYDLAVAEEHRRKGIATGLIRALKSIAKERRVRIIRRQGRCSPFRYHRERLNSCARQRQMPSARRTATSWPR